METTNSRLNVCVWRLMSKVVIFKERKTWSWIGRPERFFHDHKVDMNGFKTRYEIF